MVRCRKQHKGKDKVVRARGKRTHRTCTAWRIARTARAFLHFTLLEQQAFGESIRATLQHHQGGDEYGVLRAIRDLGC